MKRDLIQLEEHVKNCFQIEQDEMTKQRIENFNRQLESKLLQKRDHLMYVNLI